MFFPKQFVVILPMHLGKVDDLVEQQYDTKLILKSNLTIILKPKDLQSAVVIIDLSYPWRTMLEKWSTWVGGLTNSSFKPNRQ